MMPAGTYRAKVIGAELGYTKSDKEQIAVFFDTEHGTITWYGYFTPAALPYTFERLQTAGLPDNDLQRIDEMIGTEVDIVVIHDEYQDQIRPKVQWINPVGSGGGIRNPMDRSDIVDFAKRMKEQMSNAAQQKRTKRPGVPNGDEDQIPF